MIDEELQDKRNRNAKIAAIVKASVKWIPTIMYLILVIAMIPFLKVMAPAIRGDVELENPMTNSQLTAILSTLVICGMIIYLGHRLKILKR